MNNPDPPADDTGLTQRQAAARLKCALGKVNRLVRERELARLADGRISAASVAAYLARGGPAFAVPATPPSPARLSGVNASIYAESRTRREAAAAQLAELEVGIRRGLYVERATVAAVIPPAARRYRDVLLQLVRDGVANEAERAALLARIEAATEVFIAIAVPQASASASRGVP